MRISGTKKAAFLAVALASGSLLTAPPAAAQGGLFDLIFGSGNQLNRPNHFPTGKRAQEAAPRPAPIPKVSSPTFYNYKAPPLIDVDFSPLIAADAQATFKPQLGGTNFRDALPGLAGFDLAAEKEVAAALVEYYGEAQDFVWISGFGPNGRSEEALHVLAEAPSYGLFDGDYAVDVPSTAFAFDEMSARLRTLIRFEMTMSARVLRYVLDASHGRVNPNKLSGYHDFPAKPVDLVAVLKKLAATNDVRALLESMHPQNPEYQALRADLEALRASPEQDIVVDPDMFVRPGGSDPDLPKLLAIIARDGNQELLAEYDSLITAHAADETYSEALVPLIKAAQKAKGLHADGIIGPRTVQALAGESKASRILKDELALERLRWHPSNLGSPHVLINAAAFTAAFNEDGKNKLLMRAVVGKPTNQTSFFYDEIEYVQFNPYWGVPRSIIINEMLPKLRQDPGYLDRAGYEVTDSKGRHIPSASIDWWRVGSKIPYDIRQVPSEQNALGELKIMFPNKHAIYMHDTPQKQLFKRDMRAYSHGCVRLQNPRGMAAAVLGWTVDQVAERLKQGHTQAKVPHKIPVYVGYFTAWPDDQGKVSYYSDIYDRDSHLETALKKVEAVRQPSLEVADGES